MLSLTRTRGAGHNSTMNKASALPPIATATKTVTGARTFNESILGARSRTVNIPMKTRQAMRAYNKYVAEFFSSRQGQQIYAVLLEEQRPTERTMPATTRTTPKARAARA